MHPLLQPCRLDWFQKRLCNVLADLVNFYQSTKAKLDKFIINQGSLKSFDFTDFVKIVQCFIQNQLEISHLGIIYKRHSIMVIFKHFNCIWFLVNFVQPFVLYQSVKFWSKARWQELENGGWISLLIKIRHFLVLCGYLNPSLMVFNQSNKQFICL